MGAGQSYRKSTNVEHCLAEKHSGMGFAQFQNDTKVKSWWFLASQPCYTSWEDAGIRFSWRSVAARSEERPGFHSWAKGVAFNSRVEGCKSAIATWIVFICFCCSCDFKDRCRFAFFFFLRVDMVFPRSAKSFQLGPSVKAQRSDVVLWLDYIHHGGEAQHNHLQHSRSVPEPQS